MRSRLAMAARVLPPAMALLAVLSAPAPATDAPKPSTTTLTPAEVARQFVEEVYNQRRPDRIATWVHVDFVDRSVGAPADARGPEFVRKQYESTYQAFPDLKFTVDDTVSEGDKVAVRWTTHGAFTGVFSGIQGKGQATDVTGISIFRIRDGQIVDSWDLVDRLTMLKQVGYTVAPPAP